MQSSLNSISLRGTSRGRKTVSGTFVKCDKSATQKLRFDHEFRRAVSLWRSAGASNPRFLGERSSLVALFINPINGAGYYFFFFYFLSSSPSFCRRIKRSIGEHRVARARRSRESREAYLIRERIERVPRKIGCRRGDLARPAGPSDPEQERR